MSEHQNLNGTISTNDVAVEKNGETVTIRGGIKWKDSQGNPYPVRNAWVQLWEDDALEDDPLPHQISNNSGEYEFNIPFSALVADELPFDPGAEAYVYIPSDAPDYPFTVRDFTAYTTDDESSLAFKTQLNFWINQVVGLPSSYDVFSEIIQIEAPGTYRVEEEELPDELNPVFSIYDAIFTGHQFGLAVLEEAEDNDPQTQPPQLEVLFPYFSTESGESSKYAPIDIKSQIPPFSVRREHWLKIAAPDWQDWDVLLHEFGHYLAQIDQLGSVVPGNPPHQRGISGIGRVTSSGNVLTKDQGVRLAWNEGLADYLSLAIQHTAFQQNLLPIGLPNVSETGSPDTSITATAESSKFSINLENKHDPNQYDRNGQNLFDPQGEGDEAAVSRILWDLADESKDTFGTGIKDVEVYASGAKDEIAIGHIELYKILDREIAKGTTLNLAVLEDLWNYFYDRPDRLNFEDSNLNGIHENAKRAKLGATFEEYNISPSLEKFQQDKLGLVDFAYLGGEWNPSITWNLGNHHANDFFEIFIFNEDFSEKVFDIPYVLSNENTTAITWEPDLTIAYGTPNTQYENWTWLDLYSNPGEYHLVITGSDTDEFTTGQYWSGAYTFTVNPLTDEDSDADSILDAIEQIAGDKNNDGIADSEQVNVASFPQVSNSSTNPDDFITLESPNGTILADVSVTDTLPADAPQNIGFPLGLLDFSVLTVTPGSATQVTLYLPEGITAETYWKYDNNLGWYEFLYDGSTGAEFVDSDGDGENDRVILHFIDGGRGDADGVANGIIIDPGAPGITQPLDNQTPLIAVNAGLTLDEGSTATLSNTTIQVTDTDNTASELTYTLTGLPDNGTLYLNSTALGTGNTFTQNDIDGDLLTYIHNDSETTGDSFSFTVSDGVGGTIDETLFNITVNPVNDAPVVNQAIADQTATTGEAFSFTIPENTFADADPGDALTYSLRITRDLIKNGSFEQGNVPDEFNYISLDPESTAIDRWTVTRGQIDYYQDEWVAADGDRSLDLNGSPGIGGIAQTFNTEVGQDYVVTFDLAGHPSGLLQTLGVSAAEQTGNFEFQATQDPNNLGWTEQSWQFTAVAPETTLELYSLQSDYPYGGPALDNVSITLNDAPLPNWLAFDSITGTFSGTPLISDEETLLIEVTATDFAGATVTDEFSLIVEPSVQELTNDNGIDLPDVDPIFSMKKYTTDPEFEVFTQSVL